jgi:hypothetical protein
MYCPPSPLPTPTHLKVEAWADDPEPAEILSDIWIKVIYTTTKTTRRDVQI